MKLKFVLPAIRSLLCVSATAQWLETEIFVGASVGDKLRVVPELHLSRFDNVDEYRGPEFGFGVSLQYWPHGTKAGNTPW
ncbi:hypothetical protein FJY68_04490 [candidate division WOR-3 bacterium]|uniref:Outer membrane protein beta-barrel domain-containing protein n=1 Tax=candidate division WOR-3 bacterium TaxID=2052148 RepID=A0A937XFG2_UNCW3|nr:hypothetical protein [candidate division WOR-3 bacterium]